MCEKRFTLELTERQLAAVHCGLRLAQAHAFDGWADDGWLDTASNSGRFEPMTDEEIEDLCLVVNGLSALAQRNAA